MMQRHRNTYLLLARALRQGRRGTGTPACEETAALTRWGQASLVDAPCLASGPQLLLLRQHATACAAAAARHDPDSVTEAAAAAVSDASDDEESSGSSGGSTVAPDAVLEIMVPAAHLQPGESLQTTAAAAGGGAETVFETGRLARLANGACSVRRGDTQVLVAMACNASRLHFTRNRESLPLQVEFRERMYASGRMPGNFMRTEGAPTAAETLAGRAIDRALRPLFPSGFTFDTQLTANVLSADGVYDAAVLAINAASAALALSPLPVSGPVGAVRVSVRDGRAEVDPPADSADQNPPALRLLVAGTRNRILMLEAEGHAASEEDFAAALATAEPAVAALIAAQEQLAAEAQVNKRQLPETGADPTALAVVAKHGRELVQAAVSSTEGGKVGRANRLYQAKTALTQKLQSIGAHRFEGSRIRGSGCVSPADIDAGLDALVAETVRDMAVKEGLRADGRGLTDLRPLHCEVGGIPVVHGSTLFQRGETQSLAAVTLDKMSESGVSDGACPLVVHYTSPLYATNEVGRIGNPSRREVGHSELVRKALAASLPTTSLAFPWMMRLNADTLASNGSSSMAAVCAGSLALAAAGLPLQGGLTAGVAIGLLSVRPPLGDEAAPQAAAAGSGAAAASGGGASADGCDDGGSGGSGWSGGRSSTRQELVVDLQGLEDAVGDMDFKVAGNRAGVTAVQLDAKAGGVSTDVVLAGLAAARRALATILDVMDAAHAAATMGAERFGSFTMDPSKIGRLIGIKGANIQALEASTGAKFAIQDSGRVEVYAPGPGGFATAEVALVDMTGGNIQAGKVYQAKVIRLMDYGAFVEIGGTGGTQALLHISEMAPHRVPVLEDLSGKAVEVEVRSVEDIVKEGDELEVMCTGRDQRGNIRLSRKALLEGGPMRSRSA